ncbi:TPA: HypC/HybG/HupF family hydrogenase formation chaperone [Candidatus Bathyarchaeota archaeon]|nr:HypC/HybG/HupF family hydrogenase formation chaperone [Candidatus Bathyarchaeota archaeon]
MCLAIPGRILSISGELAKVDFGGRTVREVDVSLVEAKVGDYVLVHAGYAIQVLDEEAAEETLKLWSEIFEKLDRSEAGP